MIAWKGQAKQTAAAALTGRGAWRRVACARGQGPVAQSVEQPAHNRSVPGSRPGGPIVRAFGGQQ